MACTFGETGSNGKSDDARAVLAQCKALGVVLSLAPSGGLAFDGPADAISDELLAQLREHRAMLVEMLSAAQRSLFILCPWCRLGDQLLDVPDGMRCERCGRLAWRLVGDAIERVDYGCCQFSGGELPYDTR